MSFQQLIGIALLCGFCIGTCLALHHINSRLEALEKDARIDRNLINICLDSINELANPGSSITIENTVEERHP